MRIDRDQRPRCIERPPVEPGRSNAHEAAPTSRGRQQNGELIHAQNLPRRDLARRVGRSRRLRRRGGRASVRPASPLRRGPSDRVLHLHLRPPVPPARESGRTRTVASSPRTRRCRDRRAGGGRRRAAEGRRQGADVWHAPVQRVLVLPQRTRRLVHRDPVRGAADRTDSGRSRRARIQCGGVVRRVCRRSAEPARRGGHPAVRR